MPSSQIHVGVALVALATAACDTTVNVAITAGSTGTGGGAAASTGAGGDCAGHVYFAGKSDGAIAVWAELPAAAGAVGLQAGNNACASAGFGDHVCDYEELLLAQAQGELAGVPQGSTAWVQRTSVAIVDGTPSAPAPGGRCGDWDEPVNAWDDGEYVTFDEAGVPTFHLDGDTLIGLGHTVVGDLQCGGVIRSLLCCHPSCARPNGAPCTMSAHCASFNCLANGTCGATDGQACTSDDQCVSGACLPPSPPGAPARACALGVGDICVSDDQCITKSCQLGDVEMNICE